MILFFRGRCNFSGIGINFGCIGPQLVCSWDSRPRCNLVVVGAAARVRAYCDRAARCAIGDNAERHSHLAMSRQRAPAFGICSDHPSVQFRACTGGQRTSCLPIRQDQIMALFSRIRKSNVQSISRRNMNNRGGERHPLDTDFHVGSFAGFFHLS